MGLGLAVIYRVGWGRGALAGLRALGRTGLLAALLFACDNVLFIVALRTTSVANTLVVLSAAPVLSALLGRAFLGERVAARSWAVTAAVAAGVAVIFSGSLGHGRLLGDLAALGAALSIAGTLVLVRRARGMVMLPSIALGAVLAALAVAPLATLAVPSGSDAALLALLGLVIAPVAFGCITAGPRWLPAHEVGLLMLLETVLGPIWAWVFLSQAPAAATLAGGAVVIAALAVNSLVSLYRPAAPAG